MPYPFLHGCTAPTSIRTIPLTPESFSCYGTVISSPLPDNLNSAPSEFSSLNSSPLHPVLVNQGYAIKYSPISPIQNDYRLAEAAASPRMSLFSCFPRDLRMSDETPPKTLFDVRIMERHPFSSQTFIPLSTISLCGGVNNTDPHSTKASGAGTTFLIIVAPSIVGQTASASLEGEDGRVDSVAIQDPPDLSNLRAFIAKPGQAVTYAAGTWHAPMVVLGNARIDFVVFQFMNGIEKDDCQFATFGGVAIDIGNEVLSQENHTGSTKL